MENNLGPKGAYDYDGSHKSPYEYDHQFNIPMHTAHLNERTIGIMITKIENLEDATKTAQISITDMIMSKKDTDHILDNIEHRMDSLTNDIKELRDMLKTLDTKIGDHVRSDTPIADFVTTKIGKWVIAIFGIALSALLLEIINRVKPFIFRK